MTRKFCFAIDRGGTFTDVYCVIPSGETKTLKLLSSDFNYRDAPTEGIRRIMQKELGRQINRGDLLDGSEIEWIRMGTTVATNALLERRGEKMALIITKGFKDLLHIGNQSRPKIFDLAIEMPEKLYDEVVEVDERVLTDRDDCEMTSGEGWRKEMGVTNESVRISRELSTDGESLIRKELMRIKEKGINSIAVVLLHSYMYPQHEVRIGELATELGFTNISLSSHVMPMIRAVPRGYTTAADAYLTPLIKKYVNNFSSGFKNLDPSSVLFMKSDGGLTPMDDFCGSRAILSGPAGGVVGYARCCYDEYKIPTIGFDMGGTSTDVSRFDGEYEHTYESTIAGVTIQSPQLNISTVAAGGGSKLFFRSGLFVVGPESAGAHPGPVCYRKNGKELTVTDANLCLGRILPEFFPAIFGPENKDRIDKNLAVETFNNLTEEINNFLTSDGQPTLSMEKAACGFIRVANETMCRPIRAITQGKGFDTSQHILCCFGGAGAQHACSVARSLGIKTVLIPRYAGILSAFGLALADVVLEKQEAYGKEFSKDNVTYIDKRIEVLQNECRVRLKHQGYTKIDTEIYLHLRYDRTDCALMCKRHEDDVEKISSFGDFKTTFVKRYEKEFGFTIPDRAIIVDDIRVRGIGKSGIYAGNSLDIIRTNLRPKTFTEVYFEEGGWQRCPVYILNQLSEGDFLAGPSIIIDQTSTILVEPMCYAEINRKGDVKITIGAPRAPPAPRTPGGFLARAQAQAPQVVPEQIIPKEERIPLDAIQLSIFSHRFMSIAEQMGHVLQKTAISTNIKERLDFSCAVFGPDAGLVSNAPHIPVHLGAMQEAVQYQMKTIGNDLKLGDVILSNHPSAGGSHLPDLTVITPCFDAKEPSKPLFFVASRGHHADIGGISPGSMPPNSKFLWEEGATFKSFKLVSEGKFMEEEVTKVFNDPCQFPGCVGTRNLADNLADLRAQIAANQKGITLIQELIAQLGLPMVQAVRVMLKQFSKKLEKNVLQAEDFMDDGTIIKLKIEINQDGSATFDFTGTGPQSKGNCNAPRAITYSAIIYCLRCLVGQDIPLNQGCLKPIKIIIPDGSILSPSEEAAVVGGNVLTSQRIVDVILKAFEACAASQGCTNNLTFGDDKFGYYETIAGGAGAGPTWHGRSGVHTHITNTRITDPEILESRYPVILNHFSLEKGTGGNGKFRGGDGVRRELIFRKPLTVSILSERRVYQPYGLFGGDNGSKGMNLLTKNDKEEVNLGGKTSTQVEPGNILTILTPGGGGYGPP